MAGATQRRIDDEEPHAQAEAEETVQFYPLKGSLPPSKWCGLLTQPNIEGGREVVAISTNTLLNWTKRLCCERAERIWYGVSVIRNGQYCFAGETWPSAVYLLTTPRPGALGPTLRAHLESVIRDRRRGLTGQSSHRATRRPRWHVTASCCFLLRSGNDDRRAGPDRAIGLQGKRERCPASDPCAKTPIAIAVGRVGSNTIA